MQKFTKPSASPWYYLVAVQMKEDIAVMPRPEAATTKISTNSRFLLKYCATIKVDVSLVRPTPIPKEIKKNYFISLRHLLT